MRKLTAYAFMLALVQSVAFPSLAEQARSDSFELRAEGGAEMPIKELLFKDFGYDLPISGNFPDFGGRSNPIGIHSSDPQKIIETMYLTVHGMNLGLGRALKAKSTTETLVGVLWRPDPEQWIEYHPKEQLYSFCFERKALKEDEINSDAIRFFFKLSDHNGAKSQRVDLMEFPSVIFGGIKLPRSIGWLHFNDAKSVDYAKQNDRPDLGMGFAFEALGMKATVYIYPVSAGVVKGEETLLDAFNQSSADVEEANEDLEAWPDNEASLGFMERSWMQGQHAERATVLGITIVRGHFVKYRLTWTRDTELDQAAGLFMVSLKRIVSNP
jgi:hypothetical protein